MVAILAFAVRAVRRQASTPGTPATSLLVQASNLGCLSPQLVLSSSG